MTLIKYFQTLKGYGYRARSSQYSPSSDHIFVINSKNSWPRESYCFVHSRKQIERMSEEELIGKLMERLFLDI